MGLFDRLFGRKTEQPTAQKAESPAEETPEQRKQRETEIYVAKRGKKPRVLSEEEKARIREEQKKQKPISKEEREEIVRDLAKEMASYISVGEPRNVSDRIPLEETSAFKRLATSGLEWKSPPSSNSEALVDYDHLIDEIVAETPHELLPIGNTEPICPYCSTELKKKPGAKKKCPECGNNIYVRTRPLDGAKILVTEDQIGELKTQEIIKKSDYVHSIQQLKERFNKIQSSGGLAWRCDAGIQGSLAPFEAFSIHGKIISIGSEEERVALKILCLPGCYGRPVKIYNDPMFDHPDEYYAHQRYERAQEMLQFLPESKKGSEYARKLEEIVQENEPGALKHLEAQENDPKRAPPKKSDFIKSESIETLKRPLLKEIGVVDPICPYCGNALEKMPGRKKKCPSCSNFIFVRTRPLDEKRVLIREDQKEEMEEQWAIKHDVYEEFSTGRWGTKEELESMRDELRKRSGREPLERDIQWQLFNKKTLEHASNYDMGLYTNVVLHRAEFLQYEGRSKQALVTYLEVAYLDLNGPFNCGGVKSPSLLKEYPPFNPKYGMLPPGILVRINNLSKHLKLTTDEVKALFFERNGIAASAMKLPISPSEAWARIERELVLNEPLSE